MNFSDSQDVSPQSVGIDIAEKTLEVRLGAVTSGHQYHFTRPERFPNTKEGFRQMIRWVQSKKKANECWFIMEATGVYYEELAYFLHQKNRQVCVLVPKRVHHWAKSLPIKSKTDAIDARLLARYGLERRPERWQPGSERLRQIKALLRERGQLQQQRTQLINRRHAARQAWNHPESSLHRLTDHIQQIDGYIEQITHELDQLWQSEEQLAEPIRRIGQITGLGCRSVLQVVAETNGFALISNRNQLASYAGLDVVLDQSGRRRGTTKISKQGNARIRQALYMPAVCASQHNRALRAFYKRLVARHPDHKKIALVGVMRKLLLLIYSLWKSGQRYDPEFHYRQITNKA
ncbi:Transposase [Fodinibius roseus]|uniref:Transposase n=1 Tax=Fodinibius roseus TaxID=1194090 RepID=A0A1M5DXS2_9BACT|nr:IS110 family transposase [Fodinibius roseus]SHF71745.1 Transposase [Fodinibius roseus]